MGKKALLVTCAILFGIMIVASGAYGVLAYYADPAGMTNIAKSSAQQESESDGGASQDNSSTAYAEDFTVESQNGDKVSLSSFKGRPVVVSFWTSWCTYCKQEMPLLQKACEEYSGKVDFMLVNSTADARETRELADAYIAEQGYDLPFYFDTEGEAMDAFTVRGYPTMFLINQEGRIAGYASGVVDEQTLTQALDALLDS